MTTKIVSFALYIVLPLVGLFFLGWDWREVVLLYWFENITLGAITVINMIRTPRTDAPLGGGLRFDFRAETLEGHHARWVVIPFFLLHYGLFTLVHGVFVFLLVFGVFNGFFAGFEGFTHSVTEVSPVNLGAIALAWGIGSVAQLVGTFMQPRDTLPSIHSLFVSPYKRIVVLHIAVLFSAFLISLLGWPPIAAVLLIVLHVLTDLPAVLKPNCAT